MFFSSVHGICVCAHAPTQHPVISLNEALGERLSRVVAIFSHIPALLPSPSTQREWLSDTVCDIPLTYQALVQMCQRIKRAPRPGFILIQNTWLSDEVRVQLCDTKQQRFANSRLCDVQSFYSLSSSAVRFSPRQCQSSYSQQATVQSQCMDVWFCHNCCNLMVYHL